jgi:hypothetical protein
LPNDFPLPDDPYFNFSPLFSHASRPLSFIFCHLLFLPPPPPFIIICRPMCNFLFSLFASSTPKQVSLPPTVVRVVVCCCCSCTRLLSNHCANRAEFANGAEFTDGAELACRRFPCRSQICRRSRRSQIFADGANLNQICLSGKLLANSDSHIPAERPIEYYFWQVVE